MPPAPRISVRKTHGLHLGCRVTSSQVGPRKLPFTITEKLLCETSAFFRDTLQPNRQPLKGVCLICREKLKEDTEEFTYCSSCGDNFHYTCLERRNGRAAPATCPRCEHAWREQQPPVQMFDSTTVKGFDIYTEWVYNRSISIAPKGSATHATWAESLVDAYALAIRIDDQSFCRAILQSIIEVYIQDNQHPGPHTISYAYCRTAGPCSLRTLLVGLYLNITQHDDKAVEKAFNALPVQFIRDLGAKFVTRPVGEIKVWTVEELTARYLPALTREDD